MSSAYADLPRTAANHVALSPTAFLAWAGEVYGHRCALIHGHHRQSWAETYARCRRLAGALAAQGIGAGDTVAVMAPNIPATYELHFGPAMIGAVLNTLNVRLDATTLGFMLGFGEARIVFVDRAFAPVMAEAIAGLDEPPLVIDIDVETRHGRTISVTVLPTWRGKGLLAIEFTQRNMDL